MTILRKHWRNVVSRLWPMCYYVCWASSSAAFTPRIYKDKYIPYSSRFKPRSRGSRPLQSGSVHGRDHDLRSAPTLHLHIVDLDNSTTPESESSHPIHHLISSKLNAENFSEVDIFGPSLLLVPFDYTSPAHHFSQWRTADNEEALGESLQLLGAMTLSDPAFGLGAGEIAHATTGEIAHEKKTYKLPPSLLEPQKFFSTSQLKLPELALPYKHLPTTITNTSSSAKILVPVFNVTSIIPLVNASSLAALGASNASAYISGNVSLRYDPLAFWDEQANYTMQQMEAAQRTFLDYSVNASRQIDEAQRALFDYGAAAMGSLPASPAGNSNYNRNKMLSIEELEAYLRLNGYVKQSELGKSSADNAMSREVPTSMGVPISQFGRGRGRVLRGKEKTGFQSVGVAPPGGQAVRDGVASTATLPSAKQPKGRVAFPQPSILSYTKLKWGSTVSASFLGMIGGVTIFPNLWLLGAIFGGLYGYEISKNLAERPPSNALSNLIVYLGREITKVYLKVFDFGSGMWFMYKTGQLSYEYWQKYAALDQQFAIQSKIDAWNAKFLKGKENFDRWEQENEIGRKLLAGLRTAWLVEENAFKKSARQKKSRYRVVQWFYDGNRYVIKKVKNIYSERGHVWKEIRDLAEGMRQELVNPSQWQASIRPRIAAALAALTFVNLTGTLFSVSPALLGVVAVVLGGVVWPTWFSEWLSRVSAFFEETKAKGRGEEFGQLLRNTLPGSGTKTKSRNSSLPTGRGDPTLRPNTPVAWSFGGKKDKERYHFYRRSDGSKRWYRAGRNPWDAKSSLSNLFGQKKQEEERPWWSLN